MIDDAAAQRTLVVAGQVISILERHGVKAAFIGAAALNMHGYERASDDVDIGIVVTTLGGVSAIARDIEREVIGVHVETRLPDADDPLGGVIDVSGDQMQLLQLVNFVNPVGMGDNPGREAVLTAPVVDIRGARIGLVDVPHLVVIKLDAGRSRDKGDVVELLAHNRDIKLDEVRALCARFHLEKEFDALVPEIEDRRT